MLVTVLRIIEHLYPISEDLSLDEAASPGMKDGPKMKTKTPIEIQSGSIIFKYIHCVCTECRVIETSGSRAKARERERNARTQSTHAVYIICVVQCCDGVFKREWYAPIENEAG